MSSELPLNDSISSRSETVLVTGATGYIGARLVPRLLEYGYAVRAMSRSVQKLRGCSWASAPRIELVAGDALDEQAMQDACEGCTAAYYLVHSMNSQHKNFVDADRVAARNMALAAERAGVGRIIYLGGLGGEGDDLSVHLKSRAEVSEILKSGSVPVTVLRAAMIIGSGSASFEILRYLVDRLPIMVTPRWVRTPSQPIAVRNVLEYLLRCLEEKATTGQTYDIGGPQVVTYQELMDTYAEEAELGRRLVVAVPYFTPRLSSYWIHLVTPVPSYIARPLAEGLRNPAVCEESRIRDLIPQELLDCRTAIKLAITKIQYASVESHWTDAGKVPPEWFSVNDPTWAGGTLYQDSRAIVVETSANEAWRPIVRLGGRTGWYYGNWLWRLRGWMDRLIGGVGMSRGRRHEDNLRPGDALDFWRVAALEPAKRLSLVAEMKLPGKAILEFSIEEISETKVRIKQTAKFLPSGLTGLAYWWLVTPLHNLVFGGMLRGIARACSTDYSNVEKLNPAAS
ncbi:MAG: SDR family oxidoreductase [Candidatus Obscuribacterales bacterium]|nr:SDR family oxidoreductase [Candidatus Obscuribacterales bacterium]